MVVGYYHPLLLNSWKGNYISIISISLKLTEKFSRIFELPCFVLIIIQHMSPGFCAAKDIFKLKALLVLGLWLGRMEKRTWEWENWGIIESDELERSEWAFSTRVSIVSGEWYAYTYIHVWVNLQVMLRTHYLLTTQLCLLLLLYVLSASHISTKAMMSSNDKFDTNRGSDAFFFFFSF